MNLIDPGYKAYLKFLIMHKVNILIAADYWQQRWIDRKIASPKEIKKIVRKIKIRHDLSSFLPDEFIPTANYFFCGKTQKDDYDRLYDAVKLHMLRNKHHWQENYEYKDMPEKYIMEFIINTEAHCMDFNQSLEERLKKETKGMNISKKSVNYLNYLLQK